MFINEKNVVLEACVQVRFQTKVNNDVIVVTVDMSIYPIQTLEELSNGRLEMLWEWDTCMTSS